MIVVVPKLLFSKYFGECHLTLTVMKISRQLPPPNTDSTKLHGNNETEEYVDEVGMQGVSGGGCDGDGDGRRMGRKRKTRVWELPPKVRSYWEVWRIFK